MHSTLYTIGMILLFLSPIVLITSLVFNYKQNILLDEAEDECLKLLSERDSLLSTISNIEKIPRTIGIELEQSERKMWTLAATTLQAYYANKEYLQEVK